MLLIKYENDIVPHSSVCPTSGMTARGTLQFGIRAIVSMLSLNGLVKWSLDPRYRVKLSL
jgi:hypothetical protein